MSSSFKGPEKQNNSGRGMFFQGWNFFTVDLAVKLFLKMKNYETSQPLTNRKVLNAVINLNKLLKKQQGPK